VDLVKGGDRVAGVLDGIRFENVEDDLESAEGIDVGG